MNKTKLYPIGKLFTCNVQGLNKVKMHANVLLITRAGFDVPNTIRVRALSPSPELFHKYVGEWKDKLSYNEWWPIYKKNFQSELKSEVCLHALREVYKMLLRGENVVLVCYCRDHRYCHRKLVADFFSKFGIESAELNPVHSEQTSFFN